MYIYETTVQNVKIGKFMFLKVFPAHQDCSLFHIPFQVCSLFL